MMVPGPRPALASALAGIGAAPGQPPPGMMLNPMFAQWQQLAQAWHVERMQRQRQFLAACMLIRHDVANGYVVNIEADSTVAADEEAEKAARTEFLQAIVPMLQLLIPEAQQNPAAGPLIHALVMFGVRAFPAARGLEQEFEEAFRRLLSGPQQPPPQQGRGNTKNPAEIAAEVQIAQGDQQVDQGKNAVEAQKNQIAQQKNAIELYEAYMKAQSTKVGQDQDAALRGAELAQQGQELQSRQALERARLSHLVLRDSGGLV